MTLLKIPANKFLPKKPLSTKKEICTFWLSLTLFHPVDWRHGQHDFFINHHLEKVSFPQPHNSQSWLHSFRTMWLGLQNHFNSASNTVAHVIKFGTICQEKIWRVFFPLIINTFCFSFLLFFAYCHSENFFKVSFPQAINPSSSTTTSKGKNTKESKDSLPLATKLQSAILAGNQEYVLEPPNQEEKLWIFKSQVLIPYSIFGKTHALMGPMHDPSVDITKLIDFSLLTTEHNL